MASYFNPDFFSGNRERLLNVFRGSAPIIITANGQLQRSGDTTYPFRQDSNFWYLSGLNHPDLILVIDRGSEYLVLPKRSLSQEIFDGQIDKQKLRDISAVKEVYDYDEGWNKINQRLKKAGHIATIAPPPEYLDGYGFYTNPARKSLLNKIKVARAGIKILDLSQHFAHIRMVKQPEEIKAIKAAISITQKAIKQATRQPLLSKCRYEYEVEANLAKVIKANKSYYGFDPIVASGKNACILHNIENSSALNAKDLLLIDLGAEVENYAADISRTISLSAKPSKRQRDVHRAVNEIQDYALRLLKPGVLLKIYESDIEKFIGEKLRSLGLIKSIKYEQVRKYSPHLSSHFLGLNVHDVGDYDKPLQPGIVLTVEPGIYIKEEGLGVRIEDDVLITKTGNKLLSNLPKDL